MKLIKSTVADFSFDLWWIAFDKEQDGTSRFVLKDNKGGILYSPSAYFMKHPPKQFSDDEAYRMTEEFIAGKRDD